MGLSSFIKLLRAPRGSRRLPSAARTLPSAALALVARRRRRQGHYDRLSLALFRALWRKRRTPASLLEYALMRRDLGYALPPRWAAPLLSELGSLRLFQARLALALTAESAPQQLAAVPLAEVRAAGRRLAPLAARLYQSTPNDVPHWLAELDAKQNIWREEFFAFLHQQHTTGICVVGNAGSLKGSGEGRWIDRHGVVIRFNQFRNNDTLSADIGENIHVWVGAPGFTGSPPLKVPWALSSGPDMRFRRQNWEPLRARLEQGEPVLTVPLEIWRMLVAILEAPPSAGLLTLAWLKTLLGVWDGIHTIGLGVAPTPKTPYHHALPGHKPVGRHHWDRERILLRQWHAEGLRIRELEGRAVSESDATI